MAEDRHLVSRRDVLRIACRATLVPLAASLGLAAPVSPADASAAVVELKSLDRTQARLVLSVARTLFPHDFLADDRYFRIVAAIDARAAADPGVATMVRTALGAFPADFTAMEEARRESHLRTLEGSPFFGFVYQETIAGLYGDPTVSALLGYEDPTFFRRLFRREVGLTPAAFRRKVAGIVGLGA